MLVSTVLNLFFIPVLYVMLQTLLGSFGSKRHPAAVTERGGFESV